MEGPKLEKRDVELLRAFRNIIKQGKFEIKGEAVAQCGGLFQWFDTLDKKMEASLTPPTPPQVEEKKGKTK